MEETPVLRGSLTVKEGRFIWTGKWAFSSDAFKEGETSKFFLCAPAQDGAEIPPGDDVGEFKGYFMMKKEGAEGGKIKVKEKKVKLNFEKTDGTKYRLNGRGSNQYGDFELIGMLDSSNGRLACSKSYIEEDDEEDAVIEDAIDDDEEGIVEDLDADEVAQEIADLRADAADTLGIQIDVDDKPSRRKRRGGEVGESECGNSSVKRLKKSKETEAVLAPWPEDTLRQEQEKLKQAEASNSVPDLLEVLRTLHGNKNYMMTVELLRSTGLGRQVKALKKHNDKEVADIAALLVNLWRQVVQETAASS